MQSANRVRNKRTGELARLMERVIIEKGRETWSVVTDAVKKDYWAEKEIEVVL